MSVLRTMVFGIVVIALVACTGTTTTEPPTITVASTPTVQPNSPTETELPPAILPSVTAHSFEPTPELWPTLSPNSQTGIAMVDAVIEAVLSSDPNKVLSLIHYTAIGCTQADGLGGPPKCKADEPEGTPIEAFPTISSEGGYIRPEDMQFTFPPEGYGLFAVSRVAASGLIIDMEPKGEYAVTFITQPPNWVFTALVTNDGLVGAVYSSTIESALDNGIAGFILPPAQMPDLAPVIPPSQTWVQLDEPNVLLTFPNTLMLVQPPNPIQRGAFATYQFQSQADALTPRFHSLQFFSADSIEACAGSTPPCADDTPDLKLYNAQRSALESGTELEGFERKQMYYRYFLVRNIPCEGEVCVIREYTTFQENIKIDLGVMLTNEAEAEQADEQLSVIRLLPEPGSDRTPGPTPNATPRPQPTLSPDSQTGVSIVDEVIQAVLASDEAGVLELIHYTTTACTTAEGLGGPPKCEAGEPDGTPVEVFPQSASEGYFVRKGQVKFDLNGYGLYGVYQVSSNAAAQSEGDYWPMGDYGIIFVTQSASSPELYLNALVDETGIVRVGYSFSLEDALWEGTIEDFILPPVIMPDVNQ